MTLQESIEHVRLILDLPRIELIEQLHRHHPRVQLGLRLSAHLTSCLVKKQHLDLSTQDD